MTKFVTYYNLCPIPETKDFLGISTDKDEGNIITTLDKNIIIIIKISTQKQIRSWSVLEKLSSKVVYDRKSEKYVGVFANKSLRCWNADTVDVNKCKKLKFQKTIADLVAAGDDTLVLYTDGSCEFLARAIQSRKEDVKLDAAHPLKLTSSLVFSNSSVHTLPSGNRILTYFESNTVNGDYYLVRLSLPAEGDVVGEDLKRFKLKRDKLDVNVAGAAVIEGDGTPMLLTIWSDKRIFLLSLADDIYPERSPGNFVSLLTQLKVDSPLSVLGISKHFVAIYGANHGQEGASLLLYNTQYKVIKTKQFFKVYFNYSQLWSVADHIVLAMGQNLSVVKYRVLKEVLSELVGTQVTNDLNTPVEIEHINEEDVMEECLQYSKEVQQAAEPVPSTKPKSSNVEQADGFTVAFTDTQEFDKELNSLRQMNLHVDIVHDDSPLEDVQIHLMSNYNDEGFVCPEIQMISRQLEKSGAGENEITEKLLTVLMKANLIQDIGMCLRRYTNISEKILSRTLNFILKNYKENKNFDNASKNNSCPAKNPQMDVEVNLDEDSDTFYPNIDLLAPKKPQKCNLTEMEDILNILLACNFDAEIIAVHMRKNIDYPEVIVLLQHLFNMLTSTESAALEERPSLYPTSVDFELQLLRWFGVVLNSHFQKLALSKDEILIELLYKWHELFQSYKEEIAGLEKVAALLHNIVDRKTHLKDKSSSKWYSIEEVYLF